MTTAYDVRCETPRPGDVPGDPSRCVIHNYIQRTHTWAKHISVGYATIRVWDYRCEHNPDGRVGGCERCPGRCLQWATPLSVVRAMKVFDKGNREVDFPAFVLREDEADVVVQRQDRQRKRQVMAVYRVRVATGEIKVNHLSEKAKARALSDRRKG